MTECSSAEEVPAPRLWVIGNRASPPEPVDRVGVPRSLSYLAILSGSYTTPFAVGDGSKLGRGAEICDSAGDEGFECECAMSFWNELKRRNVFRVGLVYLASAWLIAQVASLIAQWLELPTVTMQLVLMLLAIGFPVAVVVAWLFELTPDGLKRTDEVDVAQSIRPMTGRKLDRILIGVLALIVAAFAVDRFVAEPPATASRSARPPIEAGAGPTLAVLPFADFSTDKDQGPFADGVTDELLNALARMKGLEVTGRTSSFYFKGRNEDLRTIGEKLGVEYVLEGSVQKDGDRLRIIAQLINAGTGYHLWSQTYEKTQGDIFAIQDDIAMSVADALQVALGVGDLGQRPGMTRNVEAYDEFLLASVGDADPTAEGALRTIGHLQRAVGLDPDFGLAWMGLYVRYTVAASFLPEEAAAYVGKSQEALARARALIPESPGVLGVVAVVEAQRRNWLEADRLIEKIPNSRRRQAANVAGINQYAAFLQTVGRAKEALAFLQRLRRTDPLAPGVAMSMEEAYAATGDLPAALAEVDRGLSLDVPQGVFRNTALISALATGDQTEIDKRFTLYLAVDDGGHAIYAAMKPLLDDPQAALADLHRRAAEARRNRMPLVLMAIAHLAAYFGDADFALDALRETVENTPVYIGLFGVWRPIFRDVRKLPGFKDLVRSQGLADYWRATGKWGDFCHAVGDDDFECS